jgi:2-phosphosulfolactate phosphatase
MEFEYFTLDDCHAATGTVVAIDVLRAFSAAAFALAAGAKDILLTSTIDEAFELKQRFPGALIFGENRGLKVDGFDFGNSPTELLGQSLSGKRLIQRTSAGTQGVVRSAQARQLLVGSFVCAAATARYLRRLAPKAVSFVITGRNYKFDGDEDLAFAEYLAALLRGESPDPAPYLARVPRSTAGRKFTDPNQPKFLASDLEFCMQLDRFDFAMPVNRYDGLLILNRV